MNIRADSAVDHAGRRSAARRAAGRLAQASIVPIADAVAAIMFDEPPRRRPATGRG